MENKLSDIEIEILKILFELGDCDLETIIGELKNREWPVLSDGTPSPSRIPSN